MKRSKELFIFYIYLYKEIFHHIRKGDFNRTLQRVEEKKPLKELLRNLLIRAFFTSIVLFFVVVYVHQGALFFNQDGSSVFNKIALFEIAASFVFLFSVFLVHHFLASMINSRVFSGFNPVIKGAAEAFLIAISTAVLLILLFIIPFTIAFPEIEIPANKLRFNFIFISLVSLFFYYFVERERSKKQLQEEMLHSESLQKESFRSQLEMLKNQVHPHFLFNSLNVLNSLITQDQQRAQVFTEKLSDLYRSFLQNSERQLIPLKKELDVCKSYMYLLETRFGKALRFETDVATQVQNLQVPPGSLQMLLENAIKHNGSTRKKPLVIKVSSEDEILVVRNNLQPRAEKADSTKTGIENIKSRYEFLSDKPVIVQKTQLEFIVRLPLLKVNAHEDPDY